MRFISILVLAALLGVAPFSPIHSSAAFEDIIDYGPIDRASGWLVTADRLYLTRDFGASWQTVTPARLADEMLLAADFLPTGDGWAVLGRPAENDRSELRLARTADWGVTWSYTPLPLFAPDDSDPTIAGMRLDFASATDGVLRVRHVSSSNFARWSAWRTADGGGTWQRADDIADIPSDGSRYVDAHVGWRLASDGQCSLIGDARVCRQTVTLTGTDDGGQMWQAVPLPAELAAERTFTVAPTSNAASAVGMNSRTLVVGGQGFDKCEVATLGQFADWRANSPYSATNLYIGGSRRACSNRALTADYLRQVAAQGWTFIPTWVGPQSPCWGSGNGGISRDPATAQSQGWAEAQSAADRLTQLGLTEPDGTGSVVYYDMEYYNTSDATCNAAVQAFVTGWVNGLRDRGTLPGVYGTGSTLRLLVNQPAVPSVIWAAHWIYDAYTPEASVWDVYALSNGLWLNHQRLRQYTGGHTETWGITGLNIDANVLDGVVAVADPPSPTPTPTVTPTPTATPTRIPFTPTAWHYLPMLLR